MLGIPMKKPDAALFYWNGFLDRNRLGNRNVSMIFECRNVRNSHRCPALYAVRVIVGDGPANA